MTARQFVNWMRYHEVNPWDEWRGDLRAGIIAAATIAPHAKKGRRIQPQDFMPQFGPRPKRSASSLFAQFIANTKACGGKILGVSGGKGQRTSRKPSGLTKPE